MRTRQERKDSTTTTLSTSASHRKHEASAHPWQEQRVRMHPSDLHFFPVVFPIDDDGQPFLRQRRGYDNPHLRLRRSPHGSASRLRPHTPPATPTSAQKRPSMAAPPAAIASATAGATQGAQPRRASPSTKNRHPQGTAGRGIGATAAALGRGAKRRPQRRHPARSGAQGGSASRAGGDHQATAARTERARGGRSRGIGRSSGSAPNRRWRRWKGHSERWQRMGNEGSRRYGLLYLSDYYATFDI
ncbi:hypothetical protein PVAP13_6KG260506 [Panicum virgatum]|uniref:Uncharacterized protein n=1 Tax=Panicum virgatum TaxID=38727 RepID=A0A8T0RFE8_PANVG|nr:hypothetical protein PVAP13_6KG260506 [Panicum virgatum]